ncbi:MAG: cyanophycinase [Planctomycetota bacterium]
MSDRRGYIVPIGGAEDKEGDRLILKRFVSICGGRDARIAVIPTASHVPETGPDYERHFRRIGVRSAPILDIRRRADCERREFLDALERADGVFMTGGHQLRLSTGFGGTPIAETLLRRNREGVHVAGTSAGASYMSTHMIAYGEDGPTPKEGQVTLAPGLGLTPKVVVDQHFRQRDRLGRLIAALSYNPDLVGIGLDEDTAAFIDPDDRIEIVGGGAATIVDPGGVEYTSMDAVDRGEPVSVIGLRIHVLVNGGDFDLVTREASPGVTTTTRR